MNNWDTALYVPVIRTRAAELKGLRELLKASLSSVLPVVEFTRSRRSKKNPSASVDVSVDALAEIIGDLAFIADLTSLDSQINGDISALLDPEGGFRAWTAFCSARLAANAIPVVHLLDPFDEENCRRQVTSLLGSFSRVALRLPPSYFDLRRALETVASISGAEKFVVLADAGFVKPIGVGAATSALMSLCETAAHYRPARIATLASAFPSSVVSKGYGDDGEGEFSLAEVEISESIKTLSPSLGLLHGDYACIHPLDFDGTVTAWVPRVDVPLDERLYYYRRRRHEGGYVAAAKLALHDRRYVPLDCWGHENVVAASSGEPLGRSPSHWISVRLNFHVSRQIARLRAQRDLLQIATLGHQALAAHQAPR